MRPPSSRDSQSPGASRKMARSPRFAHKAPVIYAGYNISTEVLLEMGRPCVLPGHLSNAKVWSFAEQRTYLRLSVILRL